MLVKGLEQAIANLNSISKRAVSRAPTQTVNRIAAQAVNRSVSAVVRSTRVPRKLVRQYARIRRATVEKPCALIRINHGSPPAIKLGPSSMRLSQHRRGRSGANSELRMGRFRFPEVFIQRLANDRWHVLRRTTKSRYPIEVVSIPLSVPLTETLRAEVPKLTDEYMPWIIRQNLFNQLRLILKQWKTVISAKPC